MAVEPNQLPEDGRGAPTNPIRMPPKGLSKDKHSIWIVDKAHYSRTTHKTLSDKN